MNPTDYGLGRIPSPPDDRDRMFPFSRALPAAVSTRTYRYWTPNARLNQNGFPHCVGYSCTHLRSGSPVRISGLKNADGDKLYNECKAIDGYNGDGTWVRVAAKVMRTNNYISTYLWAQNMFELTQWLLERGPVVVGTIWTENMFRLDAKGFLWPTGDVVGGHAYLLDGINVRQEKARILNSWGTNWGLKGHAWLKLNVLEQLLFDGYGEAMTATETTV